MTRILFHIIMAISFAFEENRLAQTDGSYVPSILLTCILPLHVTWFVGCIKGFIRRAKGQAQITSTPPASPVDVAHGPSPAPSSTRPTSLPPSHAPAPRLLRLRLSHRRQSFERALRSFRYDFLESPTSKRILISNAVSAYMPRRETLYEWIGLGQRRRRRFAATPQLNTVLEAPPVAAPVAVAAAA
ncbi:hypothetical protein H0H92_013933 [Tricholoma furcatifolium]|nr:hypothetical protein H0H92_013933 [Tricholoma furcatifolium]